MTFKEAANKIIEFCTAPDVTFTCPNCGQLTETRTDVDRAACHNCESVFETQTIIIYKILEMTE